MVKIINKIKRGRNRILDRVFVVVVVGFLTFLIVEVCVFYSAGTHLWELFK